MVEEIWYDIKDYEGLYKISNYGKIKSLDRLVKHHSNNTMKLKGKNISTRFNHNGYIQVDLYKQGKRKTYRVHRLVADVLIPNPENLDTIDHIDGDKTNNYVLNLEWLTIGDNIRRYYK